MADEFESREELAWRCMGMECTLHDSDGQRWYRGRPRRRLEEQDELAGEYEGLLREAHAARVRLIARDGP